MSNPSAPPPPPAPQAPDISEQEQKRLKAEALEKEQSIQRRAVGRRATMLTGGLGVTAEAPLFHTKLGGS